MKKIIASLALLLALFTSAVSAHDTSDQQLNQKIHDYMVSHPEILQEMIQAAHDKMMIKTEGAAKVFVSKISQDKFAPTAGNPNGDITLIEFFDYQCSACKAAWPELKKAVANNGNIKLTYAELPFFPGSKYAAKVSLAAYATNPQKYDALHNNLMQRQDAEGKLTQEEILDTASQSGYSRDTLTQYIKTHQDDIQKELSQNNQWFRRLNLDGTPSFIIQNNTTGKIKVVPGFPRNLEAVIQSLS